MTDINDPARWDRAADPGYGVIPNTGPLVSTPPPLPAGEDHLPAAERAKAVAGSAVEGAGSVAQEAKDRAGEVAQEASSQLQTVLHDVKRDLRDQAAQQSVRAGEQLRRFGGQLQALRSGDNAGAGPVAGYAEQLQNKVDQLTRRFEQGGVDGMVDDLRGLARRRPGLFLVGAATAGFFTARLFRSAASSPSKPSSDSVGNGSTTNSSTRIPAAPPLGEMAGSFSGPASGSAAPGSYGGGLV